TAFQRLAVRLHGLGTDIEDAPTGRHLLVAPEVDRSAVGVGREGAGDDGINRQTDPNTLLTGCAHYVKRGLDEIVFDQRISDLDALCLEEGVRHASANEETVDPPDEILQDLQLARDLGAADHRGVRTLGVAKGATE